MAPTKSDILGCVAACAHPFLFQGDDNVQGSRTAGHVGNITHRSNQLTELGHSCYAYEV
jgi:hypothetical protein